MKPAVPATEAQIAELSAAVDDFEAALPTRVGIAGKWPELTAVRRERLREVHRLLKVVDRTQRPRTACLGCGGNGWYLIDPELDPDWQPCRRCLTTGMQLGCK